MVDAIDPSSFRATSWSWMIVVNPSYKKEGRHVEEMCKRPYCSRRDISLVLWIWYSHCYIKFNVDVDVLFAILYSLISWSCHVWGSLVPMSTLKSTSTFRRPALHLFITPSYIWIHLEKACLTCTMYVHVSCSRKTSHVPEEYTLSYCRNRKRNKCSTQNSLHYPESPGRTEVTPLNRAPIRK